VYPFFYGTKLLMLFCLIAASFKFKSGFLKRGVLNAPDSLGK
jgi:hypothetical protein